jgi:gluconolactonase
MTRRTWRRVFTVGSVVATTAMAMAPGALAAPDCAQGPSSVRTLLSGQGTLESVAVDRAGRLFFTNDDSLLRLDRPGGQPRVLTHVPDPGGLAFDDRGNVIVGYGNTASNGAVGDITGPSGLLVVNPDTGASAVYATGLSMANGLVRGPDGSYYASNDFGSNIDRIRNGHTERGWAHVDSGNGVAIDTSGRYLYVAQTFRPAAIQRVELAHPENVTEYVRAAPEDITAGLDGMARDDADRLFVAANGAGQVWRVDPDPREICVLLRGLPGFPDGPSAVATGSRRGPFPARNVYVVTFDGNLIELGDVAISSKRGF